MTTTPTLRSTARTVSVQVYSLIAWLLVLAGGMVVVGGIVAGTLSVAQIVSCILVGALTVVFGLGMARLLNRDLKQTAPVFWF